MNKLIESDAYDVYEKFENLTHIELGRALRKGLRKAAKTIQKAVRGNLKATFKNTEKKNSKYTDTLQEGVRSTKVWENSDGTLVVKVRIDSTKRSGSGSFRLAILESGNYKTSPRFVKTYNGKNLKKPKNVKDIKAGKFFKRAIDSNEPYFNEEMVSEVNKAVEKINNG